MVVVEFFAEGFGRASRLVCGVVDQDIGTLGRKLSSNVGPDACRR